MDSMRHHLEEELRKDYEELKQLEDKLRYEEDPRFRGKWEKGIRDIKQRISDRQVEIESLASYRVSYSNQNTTKGNSKYSSWTIEELENLKKRYEQNIEILRLEYEDLSYNIKAKMAGMKTEKDGERVYKYSTEIDELKAKSKEVQEELDGKEEELREIKRELERKTA